MKIVPRWLRYKQYYELTHLHCVGFEHYRFRDNKREALRRYDEYNAEIMEYFESRDLMHQLAVVDVDVGRQEKAQMHRRLMEFLKLPLGEGKEQSFPHKSKRSKFFTIYVAMLVFLLCDRGVLRVDGFW